MERETETRYQVQKANREKGDSLQITLKAVRAIKNDFARVVIDKDIVVTNYGRPVENSPSFQGLTPSESKQRFSAGFLDGLKYELDEAGNTTFTSAYTSDVPISPSQRTKEMDRFLKSMRANVKFNYVINEVPIVLKHSPRKLMEKLLIQVIDSRQSTK